VNASIHQASWRAAAVLVTVAALAGCGREEHVPKSDSPKESTRGKPPTAEPRVPEAKAAPKPKTPEPEKKPVEAAAAEGHLPEVGASIAGKNFRGDGMEDVEWVVTRSGDFKEAAVDVVDGRLRIRAGTIGTRDDTVKHLGVRTGKAVVDLSTPVEVTATIDWNNQANGCYLRASIFLCPTETNGTPADKKDWLKFEYVGVPPGKNGRAALSRRTSGNLRHLYTEGWPAEQRKGRTIGKQQVVIKLDATNIEVIENGKTWWGPKPHRLSWQQAYLYLQMSSHSNYPPREVFFDDVGVRASK
jgi:hypothetical protein